MITINMQYFGSNGASSGKSGGGAGAGQLSNSNLVNTNKVSELTPEQKKIQDTLGFKEIPSSISSETFETSNSTKIQYVLDKAPVGTEFRLSGNNYGDVLIKTTSKGNWVRYRRDGITIAGSTKGLSNSAITKYVRSVKSGYKNPSFF